MSTVGASPVDRLITLPEGVPRLTLGWELIRWSTKYLKHPNGPRARQRWEFVDSQLRFFLWWYAVDEDGHWLFHHGVRRLAKGTGKSPIAALWALAELCAPVRLDDFDPQMPGGVRGKPVDMPWVQIAATAESQTANTMRMVRALAPRGSRVVEEFQLDPGKVQYYKLPEGKLEVITSSSTSAEGAEASAVIADEALVLGTVIPTPTGWKTVGDIQVGDRVFGSSGPVTVTHVTPVFTGRPCFRVVFDDGTDLIADEGHLWTCKPVSSRAKLRTWTTREMHEDGRRFRVPRMAAFDAPDVDIPVDPYVLGAWLGDGSSRWAALTVGAEDLDFILNEVRKRGVPAACVVKSGKGRAPTISLQGNAQGDRYTKDGSSFRGGLVKLGVLGAKHIPPHLLRASRAQRLDLLRGLMDTDGSISKNGSAVFVNANRRLVDDVTELARSLGYTTYMTSRVDERWESKPTVYKVSFRAEIDRNPFLIPRKADKVLAAGSRPLHFKTIVSIEPVETQPVKCIEVDSDDHLFVAGDGWTLTHNTEHWRPANGGPDLAATLADNLAKSGSRMLETANAWVPGEDSVAESTYDAWVAQEEGRTRGESKILYDARIAPADTDLADEESLRRALDFVYDDCWWADRRAIINRIWDPRSRPDDSRRKYLNRPTVAEDAWVKPEQWALLADPTVTVADGDEVALFFDGSRSRDATALIGCRIEDGHVFTLGVWEPDPSHDAADSVPVAEIDATVRQAADRFTVRGFFADVREWESFTQVEWPRVFEDLAVHAVPAGKVVEPVAWDMRSKTFDFTKAAELALAEIEEGKFTHDGDSRVARHVANMRRRPNRYGISVGKESPSSARKVDAGVCVIGARLVRRMVLAAEPTKKRKRTGVVW